jgi:hypothetical protein
MKSFKVFIILCLLCACNGPSKTRQIKKFSLADGNNGERVSAVRVMPSDFSVLCGTDKGRLYSMDASGMFTLLKEFKDSSGQIPKVYQIITTGSDTLIGLRNAGLRTYRGDRTYLIPNYEGPEKDPLNYPYTSKYSPYSSFLDEQTSTLYVASSNGVFKFPHGSIYGETLLYIDQGENNKNNEDVNRFYSLFLSRNARILFTAGESGFGGIRIDSVEYESLGKKSIYIDPVGNDQCFILFADGSVSYLDANGSSGKPMERKEYFQNSPKILLHSRESDPDKANLLALDITTIQSPFSAPESVGAISSAEDVRFLKHLRHFAEYDANQTDLVYMGNWGGISVFPFFADDNHKSVSSVCPDYVNDGVLWGLSGNRLYRLESLRSKPELKGELKEKGDKLLLGNTRRGMLYCTRPDNAVYVYRNGKSKPLSLPGENPSCVVVESKDAIIFATTRGIYRYNLASGQNDTLLRASKTIDPEAVYCFGFGKLFVQLLNYAPLLFHDGKIDTLSLNTEDITDVAISPNNNELYLLIKNREIKAYKSDEKYPLVEQNINPPYELPKGFPDLSHIACNSVQLIGIPSSDTKWIGGFVSWKLGDSTPQLSRVGQRVTDIVNTRDGRIALGTDGGFGWIAQGASGIGEISMLSFRDSPYDTIWVFIIKNWIAVCVSLIAVASCVVIAIKRKKNNNQKIEDASEESEQKRSKEENVHPNSLDQGELHKETNEADDLESGAKEQDTYNSGETLPGGLEMTTTSSPDDMQSIPSSNEPETASVPEKEISDAIKTGKQSENSQLLNTLESSSDDLQQKGKRYFDMLLDMVPDKDEYRDIDFTNNTPQDAINSLNEIGDLIDEIVKHRDIDDDSFFSEKRKEFNSIASMFYKALQNDTATGLLGNPFDNGTLINRAKTLLILPKLSLEGNNWVGVRLLAVLRISKATFYREKKNFLDWVKEENSAIEGRYCVLRLIDKANKKERSSVVFLLACVLEKYVTTDARKEWKEWQKKENEE